MIKHISAFCLVLGFLSVAAFAQLQSPEEFLGYEPGTRWTPHHKIMDYFNHVAQESPMVTLHQYGESYENRELVYVVISSAENHQNLDEIRLNNLKLTGLENGNPINNQKVIVWLSYNVHGNEASSSEAALKTIYALISEKTEWLNEVIVIMDPMVNPDGRDRYVNWYRSVAGDNFNPKHEAREHREPWPGGRTNHYYFDLNRDWAWQTQKESRQRLKVYQEWMPHIHVDFHEQSYRSPYYFAPAAKPFHRAITDWQSELQETIGRNHADYFDEEGWLYFTGEIFDLFYPSYGDTWPIFNGAIGMTYEQAGGGFAGLGVYKPEGDTLTLNDRLTHHFITGLSTVEVAAENRARIIEEFRSYFDTSQNNPAGTFKSFVIKKSSNPDHVTRLLQYLAAQKIKFGIAARNENSNGYNFQTGENGRFSVEEGDFIINTNQPKGVLVRVLFEPKPELTDSITYDITAWEAHYAFGVEGFASTALISSRPVAPVTEPVVSPGIEKLYAYLAKWNSLEDLQFLTRLLEQNIKVRFAENAFSIDGRSYEAGTLIIARNGNNKAETDFDETVKNTADEFNRILTPVETGFVDSGNDFGSSSVRLLQKPNVALLAGDGTRSNSVGFIWHFFDQQIDYPLTLVNANDISSFPWHEYQVLILPAGSYRDILTEDVMDDLKSWIRNGGKLIALENANNFLANQEGFNIQEKKEEEETEPDENPDERLIKYGESERMRISDSNPGSVFEITIDNSHPLAFGYGESYMSLKTGSSAFDYLENGWNVGVAKEDAHRSGFTGYRAKQDLENTLTFGVQNMGRGSVIYMIDNPLFRGFWHNGKLLFGNAVFLVGN